MSARKIDHDFQVQRNLALIRDSGQCQASKYGLDHHCTTWLPAQVHHRKRRSQGGSNELDNLETLCVQAHTMVHNEWAAQAIESGLLVKSQVADTESEESAA